MSKELTTEEFHQLESHDWSRREIALKKEVATLKRDMLGRDLTIMRFQIEDKRRTQQLLTDEIQKHAIAEKNVDISQQTLKEDITEKLELDPGWGYNPSTLEIVE